MKTQIKICGLANVAAIDAAAEAGATHIGLVLVISIKARETPEWHVGLEQAAALRMRTTITSPPQLKVVLLLVNAEPELNSFRNQPDERGHFGQFGGRYVAETLMPLILDLEREYARPRPTRLQGRVRRSARTLCRPAQPALFRPA
jgi:hypothetical protein